MSVFLDTGFLIALKNEDDLHFADAQSWMKRFLKNEFGKVHTSTYVFNELVTLAWVRTKRVDFAKSLGNYVLMSPRINLIGVTDDDFVKSWLLFQKYVKKNLSFTDCSILIHCDRLNCQLLATYDKNFKGLIATNLE